MNQEKHYVCSECGTTSKNPGTCQADDCTQQGVALVECHCHDHRHENILNTFKTADDIQDSSSSTTNMLDLDSPTN